MFKKYSTQALPEAISATIPDMSTFTPWTNICPMTCLETSNDLLQAEGDAVSGTNVHDCGKSGRTIFPMVFWEILYVAYIPEIVLRGRPLGLGRSTEEMSLIGKQRSTERDLPKQ